MSKEKIILGIDPGTTIMGFGLIKIVKGENYDRRRSSDVRLCSLWRG